MEKRIFKYPLNILDRQILQVPKGSTFLSLVAQYDMPKIYVAVDESQTELEDWVFEIRGTGGHVSTDILATAQFIGTLVTADDQLVWHIWRVK